MRIARIVGIATLAVGCASAGSAGPFPASGDPYNAISVAEREISAAQGVGADSLASTEIGSARQHLTAAQAQLARQDFNRAAVHAQQAEAQARAARAQAERVAAERERDRARAALAALPPGGE
ncbi:MAG TPA: DUF4398 domain-containing protein [Gemmatimonadaceae bacterium]|nr:DUF4398 domain-containing protein [Gemmatimonadaceae bacterium]